MRKLLSFNKENMWMMKGRDLAMGAYDSVELSKLVGTFLLQKVNRICNWIM